MEKRFRLYVIVAALVGLIASSALYFSVAQLQDDHLLARFQDETARLGMVIEQRLNADIRALALLESNASAPRPDSALARQAGRLLHNFPDLTGLAWAPRRKDSFAIANVYGEIGADQLIGTDIASAPNLAGALTQLSAAPLVVQMPAIFGLDPRSSLLVLTAVGEASTDDVPRPAGIFAATLAFERAIDSALARFGGDDIQILVSGLSAHTLAIYVGGAGAGQLRSGDSFSVPIDLVSGQQWTLRATPTAQYFAARSNGVAVLVLFAGLLLTALTTLYLEITLRRADQVKLLIQGSTEQLNSANKQLEMLTLTDELTGSVNRRGFEHALQGEWGRAIRDKNALTLLIVDVDYFKAYNDHYGHLAGDECLKRVAQALAAVPGRLGDLVARYGGEEFAVILPNTEDLDAVVAERCRAAIEGMGIPHEYSAAGPVVTVSVGSATCWPHQHEDPREIIVLADKAMYEAKASGRNRVTPRVEAVSAA